jgi:low temperature requirement protein LtrA
MTNYLLGDIILGMTFGYALIFLFIIWWIWRGYQP